jgi:ketohexokinase
MARILGIGIATLDIVNLVDGYPAEDEEVRALSQRISRGGNATNTLAVLSQLGHRCSWGGVLADEPDGDRILEDLARHQVECGHCRRLKSGKVPVSYITLNVRNGSRTIVHYRDLPEFGFEDFAAIDLDPFDWVHFEGRNVAAAAAMLKRLREAHASATVSLEVEKPREGIQELFGLVDVLLFSRAYAYHFGFNDGRSFLHEMRKRAPQADLVCAWGDQGAWALDCAGRESTSPAFAPAQVIDTLGAGDSFNAGVIDARLRGLDWPDTLIAANRLAGRKVGQQGFDGLGHPFNT